MSAENLIKENLQKIEDRRVERNIKIEECRENFTEKAEKIKTETEALFRKQSIKITVIISVSVTALVLLFNILSRIIKGVKIDAITIIFSLLVLPILAAVIYFSIRKTRLRASNLCRALSEVEKGNYEIKLDTKDAGPYKQAYESFNVMCEALKTTTDDLTSAVEIATEANNAKTKFLTNMSHEIRTPINAIFGLNEMVIRESRESVIRGYAKDIKSAGNTLMALVNDILDTSRIAAGKLEILPTKYDLSSLINDINNMNNQRATDKGLDFIVKVDEKTPHLLRGDDVRIKQCILNMLSNAVKYTDEGSVTLEVGFAKVSESDILLTVSVADTGRGMKPTDIERLFEPFERIEEEKHRNIEGTGLGMSITKNLLSLMGSELRVESKYGSGSTFKFSINQEVLDWEPVGNIEESFAKLRNSEGQYQESFHAPNAKILVVDDSSVNLMIVEGLLKKTQIQLDLVESGPEAINKSSETKYDLILVDHMMPDMDGIETLHHLREDDESMNKESSIIALTANVVAGAREYYLKEGFNDYLGKPIEPEKLEAAIRNYLPKEHIITDGWEVEPQEDIAPDACFEDEPQNPGEDEFITKLKTVKNIFTDTGLEYSGSLELYKKVVGEFTDTGRSRADMIEQLLEQEDIRNYTIQVHALKSAARIIGATVLSRLAAALEEAGNNENLVRIQNGTPELLKMYREIVSALEGIMDSGEDLPLIDEAGLKDALASIREMADGFDFDSVDSVMAELRKYRIPDDFKENYLKLKNLVAEVARDDILLLIDSL